MRGGVCRGASGAACRDLHVVCGHGCAHAVQSGDRRHGEGTSRRRDRRARRIDGARDRCDRHPVQGAQSQPRARPCGRRARRPTRSATASGCSPRCARRRTSSGFSAGPARFSCRARPRRRARARRRRAVRLRRARDHHRHIPERSRARRARAAAGRARERAAVARARRVAEVVRIHVGPIEDRHSPASRSPLDRFRSLRRRRHASRSSPATIRRCRFRF